MLGASFPGGQGYLTDPAGAPFSYGGVHVQSESVGTAA